MSNEVQIVIVGKDRSGQAFDSAKRKAKDFEKEGGSALGGVTGKLKGLGIAAGVAAGMIAVNLAKEALGKLIDYSKQSIDAASNLNEAVNASRVVFGRSSDAVTKWGKDQATAFGLSQRAFLELATPLGALLKNTGTAQDQLAGKTINLTKRASDMASVFNTDVSTALDAITSGLKGEFDPLEQYGVHINAAIIQSEALKETHKKLASQLTDSEKATAAYNLILKQTDETANDFKNTSGGLANQQRILAARSEEVKAQLGQKLLPVMLQLDKVKLQALDFIAKEVFPRLFKAASLVAEGFQKVWTWAGPKLKGALGDLKKAWEDNKDSIAKLQPLLKLFGEFLAGTLYGTLLIIIGGIRGVIDVLGFLGDAFLTAERAAINFTIDLLTRFGQIIDGAAAAFSWDKAIAPAINKAKAEFHKATDGILNDLKAMKVATSSGLNVAIHVSGLGALAAAGDAIANLVAQAGHAVVSVGLHHRATGGIGGGLTEVGERGRELLRLPQGSMVYPSANAQLAMGSGSSGGVDEIRISVDPTANSDELLAAFIKMLRIGRRKIPASAIA